MKEPSVDSFFSLKDYPHAALFEKSVYPWDALLHLSDYLKQQPLGKIEVEVHPSVHLVNRSLIAIKKGCVIEPGAYIEGPCLLEEGCVVRFGAYIRGHVIAGRNCVIGHCSEIKNSILFNHVSAAHFNYIGDSIIGNHVNLGAGVKLANLRLDHLNVSVFYNGRKIVTSLKKLGAIVGDGAQLGCNAVTNPGTLMGKKSFCYPCLNIGGQIQEGETVRKEKQ